jgi:pSer/pThr/pTyr-binding forkhead associated (FHA) protein
MPAIIHGANFENVRTLNSEDIAVISNLPKGSALLISLSGAGVGSRFLLDENVVRAGRSEDADILLDDATVSRNHAEFIRKDREFYVRDIGSLNGTYVNRTQIEEVQLNSGDEVQIGKFHLSFYESPNNTNE